ncbi:MAG: DUF2057 family protein [Gammaproteobacteria bacterium]|nr:DUF2057 family protein [Gammaproteobacteria bacterium]
MRHVLLPFFLILFGLTACASQPRTIDAAASAAQTASIEIPNSIKPLTLDGEKIKLPIALVYPYQVKVPAGQRSFTFVYEDQWGQGAHSEYRSSQIMQVQFDAKAGEQYRIAFDRPEPPLSLANANRYVDNFSAAIVAPSGETIAAKGLGIGQNSLFTLFGLKGGDTGSKVTGDYGDAPSLAADSEAADDTSPRLTELQTLWKSATDAEKKAFMNWVIAPE